LKRKRAKQGIANGFVLLEALIAILIFSMGILALMGLQAASIKNTVEAKYRTDASFLANQIVARMWVDQANIASYAHHATGASCNPGGSASTYAKVTGWLNQVGATLPGASAAHQQIVVGANHLVTVRICWKSPQEASYHNYVMMTQIN